MGRTPSDLLANDLALAVRAGPALLLEDPQVVLVFARPTQYVLVQPHGRPPMLDPRGEVLDDR